MKPIFTCLLVCQGVQELLLLGRKENSQGMKFSTLNSRPAMVRVLSAVIFSHRCIDKLNIVYAFNPCCIILIITI